jgi:hypothetical protein
VAVLIDTHNYIHPLFSMHGVVDHAHAHFTSAAHYLNKRLNIRVSDPSDFILILTETSCADVFKELLKRFGTDECIISGNNPSPEDQRTISPAEDRKALFANRREGEIMYLPPGRQYIGKWFLSFSQPAPP